MEIKKVVPCPLCQDGYDVDTSTGKFPLCRVCKGAGWLTPDNICFCGLSCNTITGKFATCGDKKCLDELIRLDRVQDAWNFQGRPDPTYRTPPGFHH